MPLSISTILKTKKRLLKNFASYRTCKNLSENLYALFLKFYFRVFISRRCKMEYKYDGRRHHCNRSMQHNVDRYSKSIFVMLKFHAQKISSWQPAMYIFRTDPETQKLIRRCVKCLLPYIKDGSGRQCNMVKCVCGSTLCYICRKDGISHSHFCQ